MSTNHIHHPLADQIHKFEKAQERRRLEDEMSFYLDLVQDDPFNLEHFPEKYKNNPAVVFEALALNVESLQFASDELKKDREFVLLAIQKNPFAFEFASDALRGDEEIVLSSIGKRGDGDVFIFQGASDELKRDRNFVLKAVQKNGVLLTYLLQDYWADQEIATAALRNGETLQFAPDEVRANREIVLAGVETNGAELRNASDELRNDREIVSKAIKAPSTLVYGVLCFASEALRNDPNIVLLSVRMCGRSFRDASDELRANREIVKEALFHDFHAIQFANHSLRNDPDILATAIGTYRRQLICNKITHFDITMFLNDAGFLQRTLCRECGYILEALQNGVYADISCLQTFIRSAPNKRVACNAVRFYAEQFWKTSVRESMWLTKQMVPSIDIGAEPHKKVLEYAGTDNEFCMANELKRLAPVFVALYWDEDSRLRLR